MSGIVGIVNLDGAPVERELLRGMTDWMAPRGPDAQEIWVNGHVGFGHAMLRTTWESARETQPCTLDGQVWITADCRIDAREDLIRELSGKGVHARTDTPDPELILHAYEAWGHDCVAHLLGDFAFAIWDGRRQELFCARDHFGVKPFLYARLADAMVLSNMLNPIRFHPRVSDTLDELAIADYLMFGRALDPERSSFQDIRRLPAAHLMVVSPEGAKVQRYWDMPMEPELRYRRRGDYVDQFVELFNVSVCDRLRTNAVSVFMSGGLDSTSIAATARSILSRLGEPFQLHAHTGVIDKLIPDPELKYSKIAAEAIGIPIHYFPLEDYRFPHREPPKPWYPPEQRSILDWERAVRLNGAAAAHARVILRGEAADALIDLPPNALRSHLKSNGVFRLAGDMLWLGTRTGMVPRLGIRPFVAGLLGRARPSTRPAWPHWLNPDLECKFDLRSRWEQETDPSVSLKKPGADLLHPFWPRLYEQYNPGNMLLPAETRYPFLDLRLVRYLLRLPAIPCCPQKSLLRVAMKDALPKTITRRPKEGVMGNTIAALLPPPQTRWWETFVEAAPQLTQFVDIDIFRRELDSVMHASVPSRISGTDEQWRVLLPIDLAVWLQMGAYSRLKTTQTMEEVYYGQPT